MPRSNNKEIGEKRKRSNTRATIAKLKAEGKTLDQVYTTFANFRSKIEQSTIKQYYYADGSKKSKPRAIKITDLTGHVHYCDATLKVNYYIPFIPNHKVIEVSWSGNEVTVELEMVNTTLPAIYGNEDLLGDGQSTKPTLKLTEYARKDIEKAYIKHYVYNRDPNSNQVDAEQETLVAYWNLEVFFKQPQAEPEKFVPELADPFDN